jgi:CubicO group peptidase (beta-lactamase class C family)
MNISNIFKNIIFCIITIALFSCNPQSKTLKNQNEYVQNLDSLITEYFEKGFFNGNILVAKNNSVIYQKSFGFTDGSQQTKLNSNSIFNIGSIAKEYNGVAIMMLQERGLLNLNDTISKLDLGLPDWSKKVTISHLLNYVSGVPKMDIKNYPRNDEEAWTILRSVDTLLFEPETEFYYDNSNVFLQKRIVEKVTGLSYQEFVLENIIKPLKMTNTVIDPKSNYPNRTFCYDKNKKECPEFIFVSGWPWQDINDLHTWVKAMNSNVLISQKSFNSLVTNPYLDYKASSLGEYFEHDKFQRHDGSALKFRSILLNDLKNDVVVILLVNTPTNLSYISYKALDIVLNKPFISVYDYMKAPTFKNVDFGIKAYKELKENHFDEYRFDDPIELNRLGYQLYRSKKDINEVIKFFKFAVSQFPQSPDVNDSLAEMYFNNKQYSLALSNFNKAIKLGGTGGNAKMMINKINNLPKN